MAEEKSEYQRLVELEGKIKAAKLVEDRTYMLKKYEKCLIGSELVAWLLETHEAVTKFEALSIGVKLLQNGLMHHVVDEHTFKDEKLYYRFYSDDGTSPVSRNSAFFISEGSPMKGTLMKKGKMKYDERYFVLKPNEQKLYYFSCETSSEYKGVIDLSSGKVDVGECGECKQGSYCFVLLGSDGKTHALCAARSKDQEGLTPMTYEQLQSLYAKYKDEGFTVLAFPSNQFGKQEPGTNEQILEFVNRMFHVTFPMFDKTVVNGKNAHPLFKFLRAKLGGTLGSSIKWNFTKFLCDRNGRPVKRYGPPTKPFNFEQDIVELLKQESNSN